LLLIAAFTHTSMVKVIDRLADEDEEIKRLKEAERSKSAC